MFERGVLELEHKRSVKYGINIVSLLTRKGIGFITPQELIGRAIQIGYDHIQALPVRGMTGEEGHIRYYEEAWNPCASFLYALLHRDGASGEPSKIEDWILFPPPQVCEEVSEIFASRQIKKISHTFEEGGIVEVHSGLKMGAEEIVRRCEFEGTRLCLDTLHLTDQKCGTCLGTTTADWRYVIKRIAPYVDVVHIHPESTDAFLYNPSDYIAGRLARYAIECCRNTGGGPLNLIAEYNPGITAPCFWPVKSQMLASKFLTVMKMLAE